MFFWNRREVYCGQSEAAFRAVCDILSNNDIAYTFKLRRHNLMPGQGGGRATIDSAATLYYIYVDKSDAEQARYLVRKTQAPRQLRQ